MGKQRTVPLVTNGACEAHVLVLNHVFCEAICIGEGVTDQIIPMVEIKVSKSCRIYFTHVRNFDRFHGWIERARLHSCCGHFRLGARVA